MGLCSIQLGDSSLQEGTIAVKPDTYAGLPVGACVRVDKLPCKDTGHWQPGGNSIALLFCMHAPI